MGARASLILRFSYIGRSIVAYVCDVRMESWNEMSEIVLDSCEVRSRLVRVSSVLKLQRKPGYRSVAFFFKYAYISNISSSTFALS